MRAPTGTAGAAGTDGVRVKASGNEFAEAYTSDPTAQDFGVDIADFTVAEPLGSYADY